MYLLVKKILLICLLFTGLCVSGQVRFTASLSPAVIARGEYTTIRFVLENATDIRNITPPSFSNFILISGPLQESGSVSVNGKNSSYVAISFVISTKNPGRFKLPGAVADVGGKKYKSNAVELQVKRTRGNPGNKMVLPPAVIRLFESAKPPVNSFDDYIFKPGDDIAEKVNKNMHLKLEVNKTSCYVGEPIVATYKLYTRLKSESKLSKNPSFNGFSVIDLQAPDVTGTSVAKLNGRDYNVYIIRKAQLYPLQDGSIQLESAELDNKIQFIRDNYVNRDLHGDVFEDFANEMVSPEGLIEQAVVLKSKPVSIIVKPLPEAGKPLNFKGAVGDFAIESGLEKNKFASNESGKLILMVSGSGNLQLITPPVVTWPEGVEAFEPGTSDILSMTSVPVSGKKIFEYPFSVNRPGNYILPAITFSYFDPQKQTYRTVKTNDIHFTVTKGTGAVVQKENTIPVAKEYVWHNDPKLLSLFAGLLLLSGLLIFFFIRRRKARSNTDLQVAKAQQSMEIIVNNSTTNQQNPLEASEKCLHDDDCSAFYSLLMSDIKRFLSSKFMIRADEINKKTLAEKMDKADISNDTVLAMQKLLQDIEWQLYTPFERNEMMSGLYYRSHELLQMINTYDIKHQ